MEVSLSDGQTLRAIGASLTAIIPKFKSTVEQLRRLWTGVPAGIGVEGTGRKRLCLGFAVWIGAGFAIRSFCIYQLAA